MKLSFSGCDQYEAGDRYQFSTGFEEWWAKELGKRIPDSKAFEKKHGKSWGLAFAFRAPGGNRKPRLLGPFDERHLKWREWYIELPSFRYKSPDPKAYVPLLRQFLNQLAIVLEREQVDATKLRKDSELLLQRFASQRGMLERDDLEDFMAAELKKDRNRAMESNRLLKADSDIGGRLKNLRRKYQLKFGVAFDAAGKQRRGKDWLSDYVVVDLTVALRSKKGEIPDDLYRNAIEIFKHAEKILKRSRTFFCFRMAPDLKGQAWSLAMLLGSRDLAGRHELIRHTAAEFLPLMIGNASFKAQYRDVAHTLCLYSHRDKCIYAFASEAAIEFNEHYRDSDEVEQSVLSDKCGEDILCMSGVHLGNLNYWLKRDREAIPHWQRAADAGQPEALMCIAGAHARLGNLEQAFRFCKRAIEQGVSRKLLDDPDFAELRRHPLFAKLKATPGTKRNPPPAPLSPKWAMPKNLKELVEKNDGMWEDERWKPVLLTVVSDKSIRGRKIPWSWLLEFDPYDKRVKAAGKQIKARGVEPDGHAWSNLIEKEFAKCHPELARQFDSDSEMSTCVVSVKSESACKKLMELIWSLIV